MKEKEEEPKRSIEWADQSWRLERGRSKEVQRAEAAARAIITRAKEYIEAWVVVPRREHIIRASLGLALQFV